MYMKNKKLISLAIVLSMFLLPFSGVHAGLILSEKDRTSGKYQKVGQKENDMWLITYYVGYQNGYLKPKDIDYTLMTHIVVGGVGVNADGTLKEHWHLENGDGREMALEVGSRADRAGVKKLIWLGGPNEEDKFYSATSDEYRKSFVKNIISLVDEIGYDGVDIDWEPVRKQDEERILALVRDLREADQDLIITVPVNWVPSSILSSKDLSIYKKLSEYVDKMFIMSYSMAGPWPGWQSWHGGALQGDGVSTPGSVKTSVYAYQRAGVPESQLGVGIGTYATCWERPISKPKQTIPTTFYSRDMHVMSMRTLMEGYYKRKSEKWDSAAEVPYLSFKKAQGEFECGFISYENEKSIKEKVEYAKHSGLGGVMVWNIGTGYFPEKSRSKRHPLLKAAMEALVK